ncbi:MAG TPA: hypothetical protein DCP61_00700 [Treponema sp.]|nr:hypothetical protein [Treponema sp.]
MKRFKTNILDKIYTVASLLLCASLLACSGLNGVSDSKDEDSTASSASYSVGGNAYLSAIQFGSAGRMIAPGGFNLMTDIEKYTLNCAQQGEGTDLLTDDREWTVDAEGGLSAYSVMFADITENKIPLVAGTSWQFTIKAYKFASDTEPVLEKTVTQEIVSGPNPINFGFLNEAAGNGSLEITLSFPSDAGATRVVANLKNFETGATVSSKTFILPDDVYATNGISSSVFFDANPSRGNYIVDFTFTLVNGQTTTQVVSEFVRIATGLKSSGSITVNDLNSVYTVAYHPNGVNMPAGVWPTTYSPLDETVTLPVLAKNGATFGGWYESSNYGGSTVTSFAGGARGNKNLYAKWVYEMSGNTLSARGAHIIVQASSDKTYCYFDENLNGNADADEVVLGNDGLPLDIKGYKVYGGSESGNYSGATHVTVKSGELGSLYGGNGSGTVSNTNIEIRGGSVGSVYGGGESSSVSGTATVSVTSGSVENLFGGSGESGSTNKAVVSVNGGTVGYLFAGADTGSVQSAELAISGGTVGYAYAGGKNDAVSGNVTMAISGGTVANVDCGKQNNKVGGSSLLNISGAPRIGSSSSRTGVILDSVTGKKIFVSNIASAQAAAITLIADHSNISEGTVVATFTDGTADAGKFSLLRDDTGGTVNVNANGNDIVTIGSFDLPDPANVTWTGNDEFTLGTGNVTTGGTIFSVFADGGYLTVTETSLAGAKFDMGIPLDSNYKENGYVSTLSTSKNYRYIQFTSEAGSISATNADIYLSKIHFHTIRGASVRVRINLETVPIATINAAGVTYLDGSFYKVVNAEPGYTHNDEKHCTWSMAYNNAKKEKFNGLSGYLMTITSEAENKFIYDQLFSKKGISSGNAASWLGATRSLNQAGNYDASSWTVDNTKLAGAWYWACGPEAGTMFYDKATSKEGGKAVNGAYTSWNSGEPNSSSTEYCAQYCGTYIWNDLSNAGSGNSPYHVYNYVVEFTPYEATAYGPGQRAIKTALHAEREYTHH